MRIASPPQGREMQNTDLKVLVITNLTRNVVESHLRTIFGSYGEIKKIDLPVFAKCAS
jgi:RNA-binding protein with serine-rich domain 1